MPPMPTVATMLVKVTWAANESSPSAKAAARINSRTRSPLVPELSISIPARTTSSLSRISSRGSRCASAMSTVPDG